MQAALDRLTAESNLRLYVVYVQNFSGRDGQDWADRSAQASQLGRRDALLAVAIDDRAYGISLDETFPLSDQVVTDIETRDVRPRLTADDWAGAAIALADGMRTGEASGGSGGGAGGAALPVGLVAGGVALVGGGAYVLAAAASPEPAGAGRRPRPAPPTLPDPAPGETTDDLAYHASNALIELDDAVQTSEHELGLAQTQFGDEAVTDFRAALEQSRAELVQAFALRQRIDDEKPDEPTRRGLLSQILHLCATADQRLDAQSAAFDRLRDLEQNLPQVLAGLKPKLNGDGRPRRRDDRGARRAARPLRGVGAGAGRRQHPAGHGPARRRPHRDRGGGHRARGRPARGRGGVGARRGGGDRAGRHAARRGPAARRRAGPGREPAGRGARGDRGGSGRGPAAARRRAGRSGRAGGGGADLGRSRDR